MIVDDQETVGEGSVVFLEAFDDLELVGEAANGREAICLYIKARPDVILMDLMMPEMDGVAATQAIHQTHPEIKIIALISFADQGYPLGSGTVESGCKNVVHHRMRRPGRGWKRDNAQAMLAGLSKLHSGRFT